MSKLRIQLVVIIAIAVVSFSAGAEQPDPDRDILVTFENNQARATTTGAPYRNRKRYAISTDARRQAAQIASEYGLAQVDHWPIKSLQVYCFVYRVADGDDRDLVIERLRTDARVEAVQVLQTFETGTHSGLVYDDTYANLQHGLDTLNLTAAHRHSLGRGVQIAVIDSSVDVDHEDLEGRIGTIRNFTNGDTMPDHNHGTAVTSIIGARANNAKGIVGVAPEARIDLYVACWSRPDAKGAICDSFSLAKAIDTLLDAPPDILNLSLAGPPDPLLQRLLRNVHENGVIVVAAHPGNSPEPQHFPASMEEVIGVGSSTIVDEAIAGPLFAPGEHIMVALPDNAYDFRSGSSLAAAHVSGVVALLLSIQPDTDLENVEAMLKQSQLATAGRQLSVDACKTLQVANASISCDS